MVHGHRFSVRSCAKRDSSFGSILGKPCVPRQPHVDSFLDCRTGGRYYWHDWCGGSSSGRMVGSILARQLFRILCSADMNALRKIPASSGRFAQALKFVALASVPLPKNEKFDGEDLSKSFLGTPMTRQHPVFWEYGRNATFGYPKGRDRSPNVAICVLSTMGPGRRSWRQDGHAGKGPMTKVFDRARTLGHVRFTYTSIVPGAGSG